MGALARIKAGLPWWAKIAAKVVLARLPVGGRTWQSLGLFSPGEMDDPDYAIGVFDRHYRAAGSPGPGFAYLELGPGDSLASAVIGRAYGAAQGWLVDAGAYAARDMDLYRRLAARLAEDYPAADLSTVADASDSADMLERLSVLYLETGLAGLRMVPDASCDMIFSQAVLEHVPRDEFAATLAEFHRILKLGGVSTHQIDFRDHLGGGLNNLRFSESLWEAPWFARRSGFYTNRLRLSEMTACIQAAGFDVRITDAALWPKIPLARGCLGIDLAHVPDEDLAVRHAFMIIRLN